MAQYKKITDYDIIDQLQADDTFLAARYEDTAYYSVTWSQIKAFIDAKATLVPNDFDRTVFGIVKVNAEGIVNGFKQLEGSDIPTITIEQVQDLDNELDARALRTFASDTNNYVIGSYTHTTSTNSSTHVSTIELTKTNVSPNADETTTETLNISSEDILMEESNGTITLSFNPDSSNHPDWNSNSGFSEILNKPDLKPIATTGRYKDLNEMPIFESTNENLTISAYDPDTNKYQFTATGGLASVSWGAIQGNIDDQSDLKIKLDNSLHVVGYITSSNFPENLKKDGIIWCTDSTLTTPNQYSTYAKWDAEHSQWISYYQYTPAENDVLVNINSNKTYYYRLNAWRQIDFDNTEAYNRNEINTYFQPKIDFYDFVIKTNDAHLDLNTRKYIFDKNIINNNKVKRYELFWNGCLLEELAEYRVKYSGTYVETIGAGVSFIIGILVDTSEYLNGNSTQTDWVIELSNNFKIESNSSHHELIIYKSDVPIKILYTDSSRALNLEDLYKHNYWKYDSNISVVSVVGTVDNNIISSFQYGCVEIEEDCFPEFAASSEIYQFKIEEFERYSDATYLVEITPNPVDSDVYFYVNGVLTQATSISVPAYTALTYTVTKEGYRPKTEEIIVDGNMNIMVTIYPNIDYYTLTINPVPSDSTVELTALGYSQIGNSITVAEGSSVEYSVSREGYITATDTVIVNSDRTITVELDHLPRLNVEDYNYTVDSNDNVTLTQYIGTGGDVIVPTIE